MLNFGFNFFIKDLNIVSWWFFFLTEIKIEKMKAIFNILSLAMEGSLGHPPSPNKSQGVQSSGRDEKYMAGVE